MKFKNYLKRTKPFLVLWSAIGLYVIFFSILILWKYSHFYYDNLDLAIFNNVFWNTFHGHWFEASIHPASYLGDHFSPAIFLLIPLYAFAPRPETLLILQTIAIALSAIPIYLIARTILRGEIATPLGFAARNDSVALFISLLWLANPLVHNMNFFEFELMAFAVLGLLWAIWAYLENKPLLFIVVTLLILGMREDFVFILFVFSILALIEKRSLFWKWYPIITSIVWAILAFGTISMFAPHNSYKFLRYYGWLGGTDLSSIALSFASHPIQVLLHLTTWYNIEFVLGLLFPFFFFISFKNRYALLLIPPAAQIMLAGFGGSGLILGTYYAGYLVAILFLLFALHLKKIDLSKFPKWIPVELRSRRVIYALIAFACLYSALTYGSVATAVSWWQKPHELSAKEHLLSLIPSNTPIATTYSLLPALSSRQYVYLFPYAAIGKNQFALSDYTLPENTEYLLINWDEMVLAQMHFSQNTAFSAYADSVPEHLRTILSQFSIIAAEGPIILLTKDQKATALEQLLPTNIINARFQDNQIAQVSVYNDHLEATVALPELPDEKNYYYLEVTVGEEQMRLPLGYDLYQTTDSEGQRIVTMPIFIDPKTSTVELKLYRWTKGSIELTGIKSLHPTSDAIEVSHYDYNTAP